MADEVKKLRELLQYNIARICEAEESALDLKISRRCGSVLADIAFDHTKLMASDLEMFSKHARRATVNAEDVMLCVRKNPSVSQQLTAYSSSNLVPRKEKAEGGGKRKKQKLSE